MTHACRYVVLTGALAALALPALATDVHNPALNPVTFQDPPVHEPLHLVVDGQPQFTIAYDGMAEKNPETGGWRDSARGSFGRAVERSVAVLRQAVQQVTGVEVTAVDLATVRLAADHPPMVLIGPSYATRELGIDETEMQADQFVVRSFAGGVAIVGRDASTTDELSRPLDGNVQRFRIAGTLYGTMDFIERFLGIRYYYPGIGVVTPPLRELTIEPVSYTDQPVYPERTKWNLFMDFGRNGESWPWDEAEFPKNYWDFNDFWRMGVSSRFVMAHTPHRWANVWGESKPELFYRDAAGKLYMDPERSSGNVYDVSRRETAEQYIEDVARYYETGWDEPWQGWHHPNDECIPWGMPDNYVVIENERTAELLNPELGRYALMSDVMAQFHIWLCELAAERWPDRIVTGYAYAHHRLPPKRDWHFPDNFLLQQCHFNNIGLWIYDSVTEFEEGITRRWFELMGERPIKTYTYWGGVEYPMLIQVPGVAAYFDRMRPYISGTYLDGGGTWALSHLNYYVAFRMLWNPDFDEGAAIEEYLRLAYGPAEQQIGELLTLMIERWDNYEVTLDPLAPMHHLDRDRVYGIVYPPEVVEQMKGMLETAAAAVEEGSMEARRVQFLRDGMQQFFDQSATLADLQIPTLDIPQVEDNAITVDGELADPGWATVPNVAFKTVMTADRTKYRTLLKAAWSRTGLYLRFEMQEPATWELRANITQRDGGVWEDDCLEVFISPGADKQRYVQAIINTLGTVFDARNTLIPERGRLDSAFDIEGLQAAARVGESAWQLEVRIPWAGIGAEAPAVGDTWYGNFVRNKVTTPKEVSSLSPTMGNNHDQRYWGALHFVGAGR